MNILISKYSVEDVSDAIKIWNSVVEDGVAFPQTELLNEKTGNDFFSSQTFTGIACDADSGKTVGLYILHPNNVGRCGHICNASFAVSTDMQGHHIGEALVRHCMQKGKECGFKILQFNAVVASNAAALHLYEKLGFIKLGVIPDGFMMKDGRFEDIIPHYHTL